MQVRRSTWLVAVALVALAAAAPAQAAFPGQNGRIAFETIRRLRSDPRFGEIHSINPDGTGALQLTNNSVFDGGPAWSPDGSRSRS